MHPQLRIARPVSDLERTADKYVQGLGFQVLGHFQNHKGFDGIMLGYPGSSYHLEFTRSADHPVTPSSTQEDLLVFYFPEPGEWNSRCEQMISAGFTPAPSSNPYWEEKGKTFADPDGYRIVIQNAHWDHVPDQLQIHAQRIQALAQTGLTYTKDRYDIERYEELREIAASLLSCGSSGLRNSLLSAFQDQLGYATPKVDVRAIVLREGQVLLAKEAEDGLWSLPGGWADVGDRPSLAVEREVFEETGLVVRAIRLLGVWDGNLHGYPSHPFQTYKLFFLCEEISGELKTSLDSLELGFFSPTALPPLSLPRVVPEEIQACITAAATPDAPAHFD